LQRPGSARTRWGSLSAPPDPLAATWGLLLRRGEGKGGGKGEIGEGKGEPPLFVQVYAPGLGDEVFQRL